MTLRLRILLLLALPLGACGLCADPPFDPDCDPSIGMVEPMPVCTEDDPCTRLLPTYIGRTRITEASAEPSCVGRGRNGRPVFDDGAPRSWHDADGNERYWCEYRPPGSGAASPRPLLIYIHGSGGGAHTVHDSTSLRQKAVDYDLSGDPSRAGFVLVSTQGRYLHWPTEDHQDGSKHDTFHRDLDAPSSNRDIALVDHIVDSLVQDGAVDPQRIYTSGWSNGARFAALYAIARHESPTPGGQRVAAVANYSGGDPFENVRAGYEPSCKQDPYPSSAVPVMVASRTCDAVACDEAQADALVAEDKSIPPGNVLATWIEALEAEVGSAEVVWRLVDDQGALASSCDRDCRIARALVNHVRWPDGVDDSSGVDHEPSMLDFLRAHPLF